MTVLVCIEQIWDVSFVEVEEWDEGLTRAKRKIVVAMRRKGLLKRR